MSMPRETRQWTFDDIQQLPDDGNRYEVIDGELFVSPSPSWLHQSALMELSRLLAAYVEERQFGFVFIAPADVTFTPERSVQPDIFVVPSVNGRRPRMFQEAGRLLLAVEILSPSTARADRVEKRRLYRDEGVAEYWIIDLDSRTIERSTPSNVRPEILSETLDWSPEGASHSLTIDLVEYFARVLDR